MKPHPPTLADALAHNANNFDLVRLVAVIAVIYSHAYVVQQPSGGSDGIAAALGFDGAGSLGVYAFFLLSGLLVSMSFDRQRSVPRFAVLRIARLLPAVVGASLVAIFIVGPLFTSVALRDYFSSLVTWMHLDFFSTIVMKQGWVLPGVFEHNRFAHDIFAPLWTLPVVVRCYLIVLVTGIAGLLATRWGSVLAFLFAVTVFALRVHLPDLHVGWRDFSDKASGFSFFPELFFFVGMLMYGWRERICISGLTMLGLVLVFLVFRDTAGAQTLFYIAFVYGLLWVGTTPLLRRWVPRHDYSFAIFLYGFMVQQCVASLAPQLSPMLAMLISAPFIIGCAVLSSRWVERPAMNWCRRKLVRTPSRHEMHDGAMTADTVIR